MATEKRNEEIVGFGFSPAELDAAWKELERQLPGKGPDCPLTAQLILMALGVIPLNEAHVSTCEYCRSRYEAQLAAVKRRREERVPSRPGALLLHQYREAAAPKRRRPAAVGRRVAYKGALREPKKAAQTVCEHEHEFEVSLTPLRNRVGVGPLNAKVSFTRPAHKPHDWHLRLCLPEAQSDADFGNAKEELERLAGHRVALTLLSPGRAVCPPVDTQLVWAPQGPRGLVSGQEEVAVKDPREVSMIRFTLGDEELRPKGP